MKKVLIAVLVLCLALCVFACTPEEKTYYSFIFDVNGGNEVNSEYVLNGSTDVALPSNPTKDGYVFDGWYYDKDVWEQPFYLSVLQQIGLTENKTVYAKWVEKQNETPIDVVSYNVTFDTDGGTHVDKAEKVTVIATAPVTTRDGYTFVGWYEGEQEASFPYAISADVTLKAKWQVITYTITYSTNGGTANNPKNYTIKSSDITFASPSREGYTFDGWFTDDNYSNQITTITTGSTGNYHLYAKWTQNTYKISYLVNGKLYEVTQGSFAEYQIPYGTVIDYPIGDIQQEGMTFSGWTKQGGGALPEVMPAHDIVITASLTANTYILSYYLDDVQIAFEQIQYGKTINYKKVEDRPTSRFSGWTYNDSTEIPTTMPAKDIEIRGYYSDIYYIIYKVNGVEYKKTPYNYGDDVTPETEPEKTGYQFSGWSLIPSVMPAYDIEITAQMTPNVYKLHFVATETNTSVSGIPKIGGNNVDYIEVKYDESFRYRLTEIIGVRYAYVFNNWLLDEEVFEDEIWQYTEDKTVYADWIQDCTLGLRFELSSDKQSYSVSGYSGVNENIFIPTNYNGKPVVAITNTAFTNNKTIKQVYIHDGLTRLGTSSFAGCTNLTLIDLPNTVKNIESETFKGDVSLKSIVIPNSVNVIANAPFRDCTSLESIDVDKDNTTYTSVDGVLYTLDGTGLIQYPEGKADVSYVVPDGVISIGNYALYGCKNLEEVQIAKSVESIGYSAFAKTSIKSVEISTNIARIGSNAFDKCDKLESVVLPFVGSSTKAGGTVEGVFGYIFGSTPFSGSVEAKQWFSAVEYVSYYIPSSLTDVTINGNSPVPYGAFSNCTNIQTVTINNSQVIGTRAFFGCTALTSISFDLYLEEIGDNAFNSCYALSTIDMPSSVTKMGHSIVENTNTIIQNASGLMTYGEYEFNYIDSDSDMDKAYVSKYNGTIGEEFIVDETFNNLYEIVSVGTIFQNNQTIKSLVMSSGVTTIDTDAFIGTNQLVVYARGASKPADWANRYDYAKIYWNANAVYDENGNNVLEQDETITYGKYRFVIENNEAILTGFFGDSSDTVLDIKTTLMVGSKNYTITKIGKYAFSNNSYIKIVGLPETIKEIEDGAFYNLSALERFDLGSNNQYFKLDSDGVLTNYDVTKIILCPATKNIDYTFASTITDVAEYAFAQSKVKTITVNNYLANIGAGAFLKCAELTAVFGLDNSDIAKINERVFEDCDALVSMTLPTSLTVISAYAFKGCTALSKLNGTVGFDLSTHNVLVQIEKSAFEDCQNITGLLLPSSLVTIGYAGFRNCSSISYISLPDSVKVIDNQVFAGCQSLVEVKLSNRLNFIPDRILENCNNLQTLTIPFVGSSRFENLSQNAVLGYLFTKSSGIGSIAQTYSEWKTVYYIIPTSLRNITVSDAEIIPYGAFSMCYMLTDIVLQDTIQTIYAEALAGCDGIINLSVPFIGENRDAVGKGGLIGYLFTECSAGDTGAVAQTYENDVEAYFQIPSGLRKIHITDATNISYGALSGISGLENVLFADTVTNIDGYVLYGCNNLKIISIPFVGKDRLNSKNADAVVGYLFGYVYTEEAGSTKQYYNTDSFAYYFIPATLESVNVTSASIIPYGSFNNTIIKEITLNKDIEEIQDYSFENNDSLSSFVLPYNTTKIGAYAFANCDLLGSIGLSNVSIIGEYAFANTALDSLTIPNTVTKISAHAFENISNLSSVIINVLSSNLTEIGDYAFKNDYHYTEILLPNSLQKMGKGVFSGCYNVTRIELPFVGENKDGSGNNTLFGYIFDEAYIAGLKEIEQCTNDDNIVSYFIPETLTNIKVTYATELSFGAFSGIFDVNITLANTIKAIGMASFKNAKIKNITIPYSVEIIGKEAFASSMVENVSFATGSKLTTIDKQAFTNANSIVSITLPSSVVTIEDEAFYNLASLKNVYFDENSGLKSIKDKAFASNVLLEAIVFPAKLTKIGAKAFENDGKLTSINFASNSELEEIDEMAFAYTGVTELTFPKTLKYIQDNVFISSHDLRGVSFPEDSQLVKIGDFAFADTAIDTFVCPSELVEIGVNPFYDTPIENIIVKGYRSGYKVVDGVLFTKTGSTLVSYSVIDDAETYFVPDGVAVIAEYAFADNKNLETVSLPSSLMAIGYYAFSNCSNLKTIEFRGESGLLYISFGAFIYDEKLETFDVPSTLIYIDDNAFKGTLALQSLDFSECSQFESFGESVFEDSAISSIIFADTTKSIGKKAFDGSMITSVDLSTSIVSTFGDEVFANCVELGEAKLSAYIKVLPESAFINDTKLTTVTFADNGIINTIGTASFKNTGLTSILIPSTVSTINENAFEDCTSLTNYCAPFVGKSRSETENSLSLVFGITPYWITDITISNTLYNVRLYENAFVGITSLQKLTIGEGVIIIDNSILKNDNNIIYIKSSFIGDNKDNPSKPLAYFFGVQTNSDIPSSIKTIIVDKAETDEMFANLSSLEKLTVTGGDTLGANIIVGCNSLKSLTIPFVGTTNDNQGTMKVLSGAEITSLESLTITNANAITKEMIEYTPNITSLSIAGAFEEVKEGFLSTLTKIEKLTLPFVGESVTATGKNGLFGFAFGFEEVASGSSITQYYTNSDVAYVTIPTSLKSITVTLPQTISYGAFSNMSIVEAITFEKNVAIGDKVFENCSALRSINMGENAKILSVGDFAFNGASFENITISKDVTRIGDYAFANCENLSTVVFESGSKLSSIGAHAFDGCIALNNMTLPNGLQTVGEYAFANCSILKSLVLPTSTSSIGEGLLVGCSGMVDLTIPFIGIDTNNASKIAYLFSTTDSNSDVPLTFVTLNITNAKYIADGALQNVGIYNISLNEGVITIGVGAFEGSKILSVTIPSTVENINNNAFKSTKINSLTFAEGTKALTIGSNVFEYCSDIKTVVLPDRLQKIGESVFSGCMNIMSIQIPFVGESATATGEKSMFGYLFGKSELSTATDQIYGVGQTVKYGIPSGLKTVTVTNANVITYGAFSNCIYLETIKLDVKTTIGENAFFGCIALKKLTVPFVGSGNPNAQSSQLTMSYVLGKDALAKVENLTITAKEGAGLRIVSGAFANMTKLTDITIGKGVISFESDIFTNCNELKNITVPYIGASKQPKEAKDMLLAYWFTPVPDSSESSVKQYYSQTGYISAAIPSTIKSITVTDAFKFGYGSLSNLKELVSVRIDANSDLDSLGEKMFAGSNKINYLTIPFIGESKNSFGEKARLTYLFGTGENLSSLRTIELTDALTIADNAFNANTYIETIILNEGVVSIGASAFLNMRGLNSINIPSTVTSIGSKAFYNCSAIQSIVIPDNSVLQTIGDSAFAYMEELMIVSLPKSVVTIGKAIFDSSDKIDQITIPFIGATRDATGKEAVIGYLFNNDSTEGTIQYYGDEATDFILVTFPAKLTEITITDAKTIGYGALNNLKDLEELTLNSGIETIDRMAFAGCTSLIGITIPDTVTTIAKGAFAGCSVLEEITIPFVGLSRKASGITGLFGYIFGEVSQGDTGATIQYFNTTEKRTFFIPTTLKKIVVTDTEFISYGAFYGLSGVESISITDVKAISEATFYGCSSIKTLVIPSSVKSIASGALQGMNSLETLVTPFIGANIDATGKEGQLGYIFGELSDFADNVIKQDIVIDEVKSYAYFNIPYSLRKVVVTKAQTIADYAYNNCQNISEIIYKKTVYFVGDCAFDYCSSLVSNNVY